MQDTDPWLLPDGNWRNPATQSPDAKHKGCPSCCWRKSHQSRTSCCTLVAPRDSEEVPQDTLPDLIFETTIRIHGVRSVTAYSSSQQLAAETSFLQGSPRQPKKVHRRQLSLSSACKVSACYHKPTCRSHELTRRRGSHTTAGNNTRQPTTSWCVSDRPSTPADPCPLRRAFSFGPGLVETRGIPSSYLLGCSLQGRWGWRAGRRGIVRLRTTQGASRSVHQIACLLAKRGGAFEQPLSRPARGS